MDVSIKNIDYTVINCHHTEQYLFKTKQIKKYAKSIDAKLITIGDKDAGRPDTIKSKLQQYIWLSTAIVFKCNDVNKAFKLAEHLMNYNRVFDFSTLEKIKHITIDDKKVLILYF